jgi:ABC-type cobalamin/Fe3+-siderophores transport system ATPase subunit
MNRADHAPPPTASRLQATKLTIGYGKEPVLRSLDLAIPDHGLTAIIGPNGCGKSTLLRALARLVPTQGGGVLLDGSLIHRMPTREVARILGVLPQAAQHPEGIRVRELVARGRHPHRGWMSGWSENDARAVQWAMAQADILALAERFVDELSGGQRQRVWLAMALAQETPLLLLDEPTTYLDLAHQIDLMELLCELHRCKGRTLVVVLHDLHQACRYADHLVVMREGRIVAQGAPDAVMTTELVERVFELPNCIIADPVTGTPLVIPKGSGRRTGR